MDNKKRKRSTRSPSSSSSRKRSRRSSSSSSSSSSSDSFWEEKNLRKLKKKLKKEKERTNKVLQKRLRQEMQKLNKKYKEKEKLVEEKPADIPIALMETSKAMAPMTKEEWEKRQSVIRKVLDPETGRYRLIKGDGEVLEEIVSRNQHMQINKQATKADGEFFQNRTASKRK